MESQLFRRVFSEERVERYFYTHENNERVAIDHYVLNIELSESFYALLSLYEVCLRNQIDRQLIRHFRTHPNTTEWQQVFQMEDRYFDLGREVRKAENRIRRNQRRVSRQDRRPMVRGDVIAELNLGFWTRLFNEEYHDILWQPLRRIFLNMPRSERQRGPIAAELNHIRKFRNRIFHQEPVSWHSNILEQYHALILGAIKKMDTNVWYMALEVDNFPITLEKAKRRLPNQW